MPVSTPLDKIDSHDDAPSDEERVKRIIQEMNNGDSPGENEHILQQQQQQQQQQPQQQYQQQQQQYQQPQQQYQQQMQYQQQPSQQQDVETVKEEPLISKKNVWAHITDALKLPFVVAVVFFLLSLPIIDVYLAKYVNWAFSSGGTLTMAGLAVKALTAGAVMGVYDTIDKVISRMF